MTLTSDLTRPEILADARTRLLDRTDAGDRIFVARVFDLPEDLLPALCLYAPDEEGTPLGGHPQWTRSLTLAIEVRVTASRDWGVAAARLTGQALRALAADPVWTALWRDVPAYRMRQFLDPQGATPLCGEVLTLTLVPSRTFEIVPLAPRLTGLTTRAVTHDGQQLAETSLLQP